MVALMLGCKGISIWCHPVGSAGSEFGLGNRVLELPSIHEESYLPGKGSTKQGFYGGNNPLCFLLICRIDWKQEPGQGDPEDGGAD